MHTFDTLECTHFFTRDKHHGTTISTSTTGSADTMDIALWIMRNMVVHDEIDIIHIESTRGDIRTNKYPYFSFLIVLQCIHTVTLMHVTMDIGSIESISKEISLEFFGLMFSSREYHYFILRIFLEKTLQNRILVSDTHSHEWMIDRVYGCWSRENQWLSLSLNMRIQYFLDRGSIGRWEGEDLTKCLQWFPDLSHRRSKSHIHHLIDFIEDKSCNLIERYPSAFHEVDETSWSSNDNLRTSAESFFLLPDRRTSEDCEGSHTHMTREIEDFIPCLTGEFTSRLEDEHLRSTIFGIDRIECWDTEGSRLPTSSLRLDDDILASECERDDLRLHRSRFMIAEISESLDDLWAEFECRKRHNKKRG